MRKDYTGKIISKRDVPATGIILSFSGAEEPDFPEYYIKIRDDKGKTNEIKISERNYKSTKINNKVLIIKGKLSLDSKV